MQIFQSDEEGGINLRMPEPIIKDLAGRGGTAAAEFDKFDNKYHLWLRYRIAMSEIDIVLTDLHERYTATGRDGTTFEAFIRENQTKSYVPADAAPWRTDDVANTEQLMAVATAWIGKGNLAREEAPSPSPVLRLESRQIESRRDDGS